MHAYMHTYIHSCNAYILTYIAFMQGVCDYANGDKYDGDWKEDRAHGMGTYTYATGEK